MITYQRVKPREKESYLGAGLRNVVSSGANIVNTAADLATLPLRAGEALSVGAEQTRNKALEHALKPGNEANLYGSDPKIVAKHLEEYKKNPSQEAVIAPAIEKTKEAIKSKFPDKYLEPHNETEKVFQDYAAMVGTHLLLPGSSWKDIPGLIARTAVGRAAGAAVKAGGGGEIGRLAAEIAIPGVLKGLNPKNVQEYFVPKKDAAYKALDAVKGNVDATEYENLLENLWKNETGYANATTNREGLTSLMSEVHKGKIPLNKLHEVQARLNRLMTGPGENKPNYLYEINKVFKKVLKKGSEENPEFGKLFNEANNLTKVTASARTATNFLEEIKKEPGISGKAAFGLFSNPVFKTIGSQYNLWKKFPGPALKYYGKAIEAASAGRKTAFIKELNNLDKLITQANKTFVTYQRVK